MPKTMVVADGLDRLALEMRCGDYTESDAAVLITRDAKTGIITYSYPGCNFEDGNALLDEAARMRGYKKDEEWANAVD
jgi:hypothetical protein